MPGTTTPRSDRATPAGRARAEENARRVEHVTRSLEAVQKDLASIGGTLGAGARDLRRDVGRLLRDAHRDLLKMGRAAQRDLDHLQDDLTSAARGRTPAGKGQHAGRSRSEAITTFLDKRKVTYAMVEHEPVMSAGAESRATAVAPEHVAKTIVLHDEDGYVLAAIPASRRLDLHKLRTTLDRTRALTLATEDDITRDFPDLEAGAMPPFGPTVPGIEVIDRSLTEPRRVLCAAGDRRHSVLVDPRDIVSLTQAKVADICED